MAVGGSRVHICVSYMNGIMDSAGVLGDSDGQIGWSNLLSWSGDEQTDDEQGW